MSLVVNLCKEEKSNLILPCSIFEEKNLNLSFWFLTEFRCSDIFAVTEYLWNQFFVRGIKIFFCKMFTSVLLDRILDDFAKFFEILIIYTRKLHFNLGFWNIIACAGWAHAEMISSLTKHTRKQFFCTLSKHRRNFHACSASVQILTVFTLPSKCMLSQREETISSLAEHT